MVRKSVLLVLLSLIITSCTSIPFYSFNYPLTTEVISSADNTLQSRLPTGWFNSKDTSLTPQFQFWLIKEDYSGTITLQEIKVDAVTDRRIKKDGLLLLAEISLKFKQEAVDRFLITKPIETFTINSQNYCGFEYYINSTSRRVRVVLFQLGNRYFETEATPLSGVWYEKDLSTLYQTLHSFLNSLQVKTLSYIP